MRRPPLLIAVLLGFLATSAGAAASTAIDLPASAALAPPLGRAGRWLVDATGRVVMLHGVNDVEKQPPFHSAGAGFGQDDVDFLAAEGFNALRLGIDMRGLMPVPGQIEAGYVEQLADTVTRAAQAGLFVLLDFHQDGYATKYNGNGFPDWMAIDDGLPNPPDAVFPLYYIQNPAMQRAFEHFWENAAIPDGRGLQDYYVQALEAIAARFGREPHVIGTELMNEPWPGATWQPCALDAAGCPDLEQERLAPFYRKGTVALRALAPAQLVFVEPFVLFNFGRAPTSVPGTDPALGLSFHSYALDVAGEESVLRLGVAAAERDGAPAIVTEFGATGDPSVLNRLARQLEEQRLPWMFWAYNEWVVRDRQRPLTAETIVSQAVLDALVRPYPVATAGVPTRIAFDPASKRFTLEYTTARLGGGTFARRLETVVFVPPRQYPRGYTVRAPGVRVTSRPCAPYLRLRARSRALPVVVEITPGIRGAKARRCSRPSDAG